jgi:hypothetical protein
MNCLITEKAEDFKKSFPHYTLKIHKFARGVSELEEYNNEQLLKMIPTNQSSRKTKILKRVKENENPFCGYVR